MPNNPSDPTKTPSSTRPAKRVSRTAATDAAAAAAAASDSPPPIEPAAAATSVSSPGSTDNDSGCPSQHSLDSMSSLSLGSPSTASDSSGSQPNTPSPQQQQQQQHVADVADAAVKVAGPTNSAVAAAAASPVPAAAAAPTAATSPPPPPFLPRLDGPVAVQQRLRTIFALLCATPDRMNDWARQFLAIPCANGGWLSLCVRAVCETVVAVQPDPVAFDFVRDGQRSRLMSQFCRAVGEAGAGVAQAMWSAGEAGRGGRPATTLAALVARTNAVAATFRRDVVERVQAGILHSVRPLTAAAIAGQAPLAASQMESVRRRRAVRTMCFLCDLFISGNGGDYQLVTTHVMRFIGDQLLPPDTGEPNGPPIDELRLELACLMLSSVGALLESQSMAEANVYYRRGRSDLRVYFVRLERVLQATAPRPEAAAAAAGAAAVNGCGGRHNGHGRGASTGHVHVHVGGGGGSLNQHDEEEDGEHLVCKRVRDMMREVVELRSRRWRP